MALRDCSDHEAVRSRGQDLVSTFELKKKLANSVPRVGQINIYVLYLVDPTLP